MEKSSKTSWTLFYDQHKKFEQTIQDESTRQRLVKQYDKTVRNLRRQFDLTGDMQNYQAMMMIDEIALSTVRIQEIEHYLLGLLIHDKQASLDWERLLGNLKEHRKRAMIDLTFHCTGVRPGSSQSKKKEALDRSGFRVRMDRSKKLDQIKTIEGTISGSEETWTDSDDGVEGPIETPESLG